MHLNRIIFLGLLFTSVTVFSQTDSIIEELKETIQKTSFYDTQKLHRIDSLRSLMKEADNKPAQYRFSQELFQEFNVFNQDSAFAYGLKSQELAIELNDEALIADAFLDLADINVTAGMYKEALDFLEKVHPEETPESVHSYYYTLAGRLYSDMAEYSNLQFFTEAYNELAANYYRLALGMAEAGTFDHSSLEGYIRYRRDDFEGALEKILPLLETHLGDREKAMLNSIAGHSYAELDQENKAAFHLAQAAITDIKSSAKENLAMIRLAELLFAEGDVQTASVFIEKANEDAEFYGAQQRKLRVGAILPLIEGQILEQVQEQRERLSRQNLLLSMLLLFLMILAIIIYSQVRRLKKARQELREAHGKLQTKNQQITAVNEKMNAANLQLNKVNYALSEANKIKEEYIGFFFTQDADIFEKFKDFKNNIENKLKTDNIDAVKYLVENYDLKREKEKLLQNFDEAFIKLFPNFIEEFNSLLKEEEQITPKKGQLLNKELRIFALIRLGITHNEIIAQILGFSVNSIYAYKTKIRNKSYLEKKEFDQMLLQNTFLKL